jgi:hypothetical protein
MILTGLDMVSEWLSTRGAPPCGTNLADGNLISHNDMCCISYKHTNCVYYKIKLMLHNGYAL